MKKKKIVLFVFLFVGVLSLILTYKFKQNNLSKNKPVKEEKLSIMIKEDGATDYTKSSSKEIPKGDYVLNEEKSYCKNNGKIEGYDSTTGTVSFAFIGTDRCFLYFDYYIEPGYLTILNNNGGIEAIKAKGTPDFTATATTNEGMYATEDDQGVSYYFRGAVDNNWLKYGRDPGDDVMYWRIIRINGDGSIRLIYTGYSSPTESQKVVMTGTKTQITTFSFNSEVDKSEYVGYKYEVGAQHGSLNDSNIKKYLEELYTGSYFSPNVVVDNPFCYDRTALADDTFSNETGTGTYGEVSNWTSTGSDHFYGRYGIIYGNKTGPSLKCANELDKYSVSNGLLSYPIGLITADEIVFAGGWNTANSSYYLYTGQDYWTGSPFRYFGIYKSATILCLNYEGKVDYCLSNSEKGVRPVISISKDVKLSGDGTWNNPYVVEN